MVILMQCSYNFWNQNHYWNDIIDVHQMDHWLECNIDLDIQS